MSNFDDWPDDELMDQVARSSDEAAYGVLYMRWLGPLLRYFRGRDLQDCDADDCTNETLNKVWAKRDTWEPGRAFRPWNYQIAYRTLLDFIVDGNRTPPLPDDVPVRAPQSVDEGELHIVLFHARPGRDKEILRYRSWPRAQYPAGDIRDYDGLLGDTPPEQFVPPRAFSDFLVQGYKCPSGTYALAPVSPARVSSGTCHNVCQRYVAEHWVFAGNGFRWGALFDHCIREFDPDRDCVFINRWCSRNGAPTNAEIENVFCRKQRPDDAHLLEYLATRFREPPHWFAPEPLAPSDRMVTRWCQYRDRVLDSFISELKKRARTP